MSKKIKLSTLALNDNSDPIFGSVASAINGEIGTILFTSISDGIIYHAANFPKYGSAILNIPDELVTIYLNSDIVNKKQVSEITTANVQEVVKEVVAADPVAPIETIDAPVIEDAPVEAPAASE